MFESFLNKVAALKAIKNITKLLVLWYFVGAKKGNIGLQWFKMNYRNNRITSVDFIVVLDLLNFKQTTGYHKYLRSE